MNLTSYFIEVLTQKDYTQDDYDAAAGRLVNVLTEIFAQSATIDQFTHDALLDSCTTEIEVSLTDSPTGRQLQAQLVLDMVATEKVRLDKGRLAKVVKDACSEWPDARVTKRAVPRAYEPTLAQ